LEDVTEKKKIQDELGRELQRSADGLGQPAGYFEELFVSMDNRGICL
jgi:hypothetical protein